MEYYIIKHDCYPELPFMVFADSMTEAIEKVVKFAEEDGYEEGDIAISNVERKDFDGLILGIGNC